MMFYFLCVCSIFFYSYLIGSLNFSIIISNLFFKNEVRNLGSKNAGATNMLRNFGKKAAIFTFLFDFIKGFLSVFLVKFVLNCFLELNSNEVLMFYASKLHFLNFQMCAFVAVVIGHVFPLFYKFKGGKGISTSAGALLAMNKLIFMIVILVFLVVFLIFRIVSISSICAVSVFVLVNSVYLFFYFNLYKVNFLDYRFKIWFLIILKLAFLYFLIIFKHRLNIIRFLKGKEPKIGR